MFVHLCCWYHCYYTIFYDSEYKHTYTHHLTRASIKQYNCVISEKFIIQSSRIFIILWSVYDSSSGLLQHGGVHATWWVIYLSNVIIFERMSSIFISRGLPALDRIARYHFIETPDRGGRAGHLEVVLPGLGTEDCQHGTVDRYVRDKWCF